MNEYPMIGEACYQDPARPLPKPPRQLNLSDKVLVVLCTHIPKGLTNRYTSRLFETHNFVWYDHDRLESLRFTLACHKHYRAGMDYDLVIVDNDSPSLRGQNFIVSCGIPRIHRENTHFSFGAYKHAWDQLGESYDYFVFHELDWAPCKDGWLLDLVDLWTSDPEIGMIGNLIEGRGWTEGPDNDNQRLNNRFISKINEKTGFGRLHQINLDSEYLFADKIVLKRMDGLGWPIFDCEPRTDLSPAFSELAFQQPVLEMGYKIKCFNDGKHTMFYATYNRGIPEKWNHGFENLSPFVPEQVRLFITEFREYFDFYDHDEFNSLAKDDI